MTQNPVGRVQAEYTDWKVTARKPGNDTWESTGTIRNDEPLARERLRRHVSMGTMPILYRRKVWVIEGPWEEDTDPYQPSPDSEPRG